MNNEKWPCSICTYINWNASQRCVLCQTDKSICQLSQEIYSLDVTSCDKITSQTQSQLVQNQQTGLSGSEPRSCKWACSACTYFNWPKARKCVQCNTARVHGHTSGSSHGNSKQHSTVTGSPGSLGTGTGTGQPQSQSPHQSVSSSSSSSSTDPDQHQHQGETVPGGREAGSSGGGGETTVATADSGMGRQLGKVLNKWLCPVCTYENWPKSQHCVMCNSARGQDDYRGTSPESNCPNTAIDMPMGAVENEDGTQYHQGQEAALGSADKQSLDLLWLEACSSVLTANLYAFESYLLAVDGKLDRELTVQECRILNQPDIFKPGLTLLDIACKLGRDDIIELYLSTPCPGSQPSSSTNTFRHRMPCHVSPDRALAIQAHLYESMRMRKGDFPCYVVQEHSTFWLPMEIELLPLMSRCQLFNELIDKNVLRELEINEKIINWWAQNSTQNRLTALWNRTAGDCLLDSVLQATWGILDRDNILRTSLAESMREAQHIFYPRWREYERNQARAFNYTINEFQYHRDWQNLLRNACQQGEPLEQIHIFVLCHILRRPIIVYGVKYINNYRNEPVGLAHFQGVYLPLLWEKSFCSRNPIVLGYTRGHFSALVPSESLAPTNPVIRSQPGTMVRGQMSHELSHGCISPSTGSCLGGLNNYGETVDQTAAMHVSSPNPSLCLLPLYDSNKQLLPVHFLTEDETQRDETLLRDWLEVAMTRRGFLMARMRSSRRHPLVASLIDSWIDRYKNIDDEEYEDERAREQIRGRGPSARSANIDPERAAGACSHSTSAASPHANQAPATIDPPGAHCEQPRSTRSGADSTDSLRPPGNIEPSPPPPPPHL